MGHIVKIVVLAAVEVPQTLINLLTSTHFLSAERSNLIDRCSPELLFGTFDSFSVARANKLCDVVVVFTDEFV